MVLKERKRTNEWPWRGAFDASAKISLKFWRTYSGSIRVQSILNISQIIIAAALIAAILLQQRGAGGSAIFGGGGGTSYYTKRGFEKILFIATIVIAGLFIVSAFVNLLL